MEEETLRDFLVGKQDHTVREFKCRHCKEVNSTYTCDRICICGGGFLCVKCGGINMNGSIEFI